MSIEINVSETKGVLIFTVSGRVDSLTAITLGEHMQRASKQGQHKLVLDLSSVEYISSAGLREIMSGVDRAQKDGGGLCLVNPSARVMELLDMTGLDKMLRIYPTTNEAVESFA